MYVKRDISPSVVFRFAWLNLIIFTLWSSAIVYAYHHLEHHNVDIRIPFLPLSTIGIAVAFYIGFKNNASYDRFWEARKIWGGIVNYSRTWGNQVLSFVSNHRAENKLSTAALEEIHRVLIYRHIAWLYALKLQLRKPNPYRQKMLKTVNKFSIDSPEERHWQENVAPFLFGEECNELAQKKNMATQLIRRQGAHLRELIKEKALLNDFRHVEMMRV